MGFTELSSKLEVGGVITMLSDLYSSLDDALDAHSGYKLKTIGDCFVGVWGLPSTPPQHGAETNACLAASFALAAVRVARERHNLVLRGGCSQVCQCGGATHRERWLSR